jgi:hypothetical protein
MFVSKMKSWYLDELIWSTKDELKEFLLKVITSLRWPFGRSDGLNKSITLWVLKDDGL